MLTAEPNDRRSLLIQARILLVDDGPDSRRILSFLLAKAGAEVVVADDGRRALNIFDAQRDEGLAFDLVLTDMEMPDIDGYELTRMLRLRGETLPIVACTAYTEHADIDACYEAGCSAYVAKPIVAADLLRIVADALDTADEPVFCAC
ncbi:MAG: response regulator [Planctomycetia bacterium]|nr:response regulator [Planctomycetia bacterium]